MDEELSQETTGRIKAFCKSIQVAEGIDQWICGELSAHMEDKLRAYLDGREKLSEQDALLLVEHHFGDRAIVRDLLQIVHVGVPSTSIVRRLSAIICLASAAFVLGRLIQSSLEFGLLFSLGQGGFWRFFESRPAMYVLVRYMTLFLPALTSTAALWLIVRTSQRRLKANGGPYFLRWSTWKLAGASIVLFIVAELARAAPVLSWPADDVYYHSSLQVYGWAFLLLLNVAIWSWWFSDDVHGFSYSAVIGVVGWCGWMLLVDAFTPHSLNAYLAFAPRNALILWVIHGQFFLVPIDPVIGPENLFRWWQLIVLGVSILLVRLLPPIIRRDRTSVLVGC
jgi:hypothetical protein